MALVSHQTHGVLANLRAISINTVLAPFALHHILIGFSASRVSHIRLVVNHGGSWAVEFGPNFISLIAHHVPYLEELILDQIGMTEPMGLPGGLVSVTVATHLSDKTLKYYLFVRKLQEAWASEIRQVSTL